MWSDKVRLRLGRAALVAAAIMAVSMFSGPFAQTALYVGTNGVNSSSCGTTGAPCATVNYVLASRATAGSTIRIMPGTYSNQGTIRVTLDNITITASDQANRPQLWNSWIEIPNNTNNTTISYLRIRKNTNGGYDGFDGIIEVNEYPTTIDNNELWHGNQGVLIKTSQQVLVSNNEIHDLGALNTDSDGVCVLVVNRMNDPIPSGFSNAIRVTGNNLHDCQGDGIHENSWSEAGVQFNYLIIDHNIIRNNQEQGIDTKGTDDLRIHDNDISGNGYGGLSNNQLYGSTARWEIYNNRFHDHTNFAIFNQGGGQSWKIWNNQIYNNVTRPNYNNCAVELPGDSASVFYGNTVVNNTDSSGSMVTCGITDRGSGANVINNIFYNNGIGSNDRGNIRNISGEDSGTPSYNYVYPTTCANGGQCKTGTNAKTTCMQTGNCPGFVDLAARNFNLVSGSPAINSGTVLTSLYALDALGRNHAGVWDLGALEYGGTSVAAPAAPANVRIIR